MSKKDREGPSKRQEFREKRRRAELRNRWIWIGAIIVGALLITFFLVYPQQSQCKTNHCRICGLSMPLL